VGLKAGDLFEAVEAGKIKTILDYGDQSCGEFTQCQIR
jgi:hypothetical protein